MRCKKLILVRIEYNGLVEKCSGYYHPHGCGDARYNHLDLEPTCLGILRDLGFKHGLAIKCLTMDGCILLDIDVLNVLVKICPINGSFTCSGSVYVMVSHSGYIYIGGWGFGYRMG